MDNKNTKTGRTLIDMLVEHPFKSLAFLFAIFAGIFFLGKAGIGVEIPSIINTHPHEAPSTQSPEVPANDNKPATEEEDIEVKKINKTQQQKPSRPNEVEQSQPHSTMIVQQNEKKEKRITGSLNFQSPPSSEYYFIKVQGQGEFQKVDKSGDFTLLIAPDETVISIDVFNELKEKITSKYFDCTTNNTLQIIIK